MVSWAPDEGYEHAGLTRGWFGSGRGNAPPWEPPQSAFNWVAHSAKGLEGHPPCHFRWSTAISVSAEERCQVLSSQDLNIQRHPQKSQNGGGFCLDGRCIVQKKIPKIDADINFAAEQTKVKTAQWWTSWIRLWQLMFSFRLNDKKKAGVPLSCWDEDQFSASKLWWIPKPNEMSCWGFVWGKLSNFQRKYRKIKRSKLSSSFLLSSSFAGQSVHSFIGTPGSCINHAGRHRSELYSWSVAQNNSWICCLLWSILSYLRTFMAGHWASQDFILFFIRECVFVLAWASCITVVSVDFHFTLSLLHTSFIF